ncbi:MAG: hypothetical protein IPK35_07865 [Saprospiraceae bacterium]|jgi:hypothetical protein|nr:hypothetical protein [Saprospiraceae bacterium]
MKNKVVYELIEDDVQLVAEEILDRRLKKDEMEIVKLKIGDYIDWFDAIEMVIIDNNIDDINDEA